MKIEKKIRIKTFNCDIIYIVCDNIFKVENMLHKKCGGEKPVEDESVEGYAITINSGLYVVVLDYRYMNNNLIGHELYHITSKIGGDRDISDEETMAWLNGYLHEEFYTFINTQKFKTFAEKLLKQYNEQHEKQKEQNGGEAPVV